MYGLPVDWVRAALNSRSLFISKLATIFKVLVRSKFGLYHPFGWVNYLVSETIKIEDVSNYHQYVSKVRGINTYNGTENIEGRKYLSDRSEKISNYFNDNLFPDHLDALPFAFTTGSILSNIV